MATGVVKITEAATRTPITTITTPATTTSPTTPTVAASDHLHAAEAGEDHLHP